MKDVPTAALVESLQEFMHSVKVDINRKIKAIDTPVPSVGTQLEKLRLQLDAFNLGSSTADNFTSLLLEYERLRHVAFPEEVQDLLRLQPDLPIWPKKRHAPASTPLEAEQVTDFFQDLYLAKVEPDALWFGTANCLLQNLRVCIPSPMDLSCPFTKEEILTCIKAAKKDTTPGLNGIPMDALLLGGKPLAEFLAKVLNAAMTDDADTIAPFAFKVRSSLLFKNKNHNSKSDPSAYRAIAVYDVEARILHAAVGNRLKD